MDCIFDRFYYQHRAMRYYKSLICILFIVGNSGPAILNAQDREKPIRIWFDTDIMIGLPERAPREVDDGVH
jgi:hypothetical protein